MYVMLDLLKIDENSILQLPLNDNGRSVLDIEMLYTILHGVRFH